MDVRNLDFVNGSFDVAIDKGAYVVQPELGAQKIQVPWTPCWLSKEMFGYVLKSLGD
jgi:hypothetical protein